RAPGRRAGRRRRRTPRTSREPAALRATPKTKRWSPRPGSSASAFTPLYRGSCRLMLARRRDLAGPRGLDLHLDLPRLGLRPLRQHEPQHAVPALGRDVLGVHRAGQREAAAEGAVGALDPVVAFALLGLLQLALAANRQLVRLDLDVDILRVHLGQLHLQRDRIGVLEDVDRGRPRGGETALLARGVRLAEGLEQLVLQPEQVAERVVPGN